MKINLDFESRSLLNLKKCGLYVYAAHPSTEIICAAYAIDDGPVHLWRMHQPVPNDLILAVMEGGVEWHAWNAQFERIMWREVWARPGGPMHAFGAPALEDWYCTMAQAALYGLPLGLAMAAAALKIPERKDMGGRSLMLRMTRPRSFAKDGSPIWWEEEDKMVELGRYCQNDVVVERSIGQRLKPMPRRERRLYLLDQTINDRGVRLDQPLAKASQFCASQANERADEHLSLITAGSVTGVNQVKALTRWLVEQGVEVTTLNMNAVEELLLGHLTGPAYAALEIRAEAAKSSVAKLQSMLLYATVDGRMRGLLQFSGAATGRWAGRGPQPQNFPKGSVPEVESLIPLVMSYDLDMLDAYAPALMLISSMLRAHLIPAPGHTFLAGDYAAIEARVLAWLAGQQDLLEMFRKGEDVYKAMAAKVYAVPVDRITKYHRAFGKVAVLGLGYQMGRKTFRKRCALSGIDIEEDFAADTVSVYRAANFRIAQLWEGLDRAAREAVRAPGTRNAYRQIVFIVRGSWLEMILPSGRSLYYAEPRLQMVPVPWDENERKEAVVCYAYNNVMHKWMLRKMYGGLWTENATQAMARDILAESMLLVEESGFPVVMTVHDEIVCEVPEDQAHRLGAFTGLMARVPDWADGCPVEVESWEGKRYRK